MYYLWIILRRKKLYLVPEEGYEDRVLIRDTGPNRAKEIRDILNKMIGSIVR